MSVETRAADVRSAIPAAASTLSSAPAIEAVMIHASVDILRESCFGGSGSKQYIGPVKPTAQPSIQMRAAIRPLTLSRRWEKNLDGLE